jgi:hypothetical protein
MKKMAIAAMVLAAVLGPRPVSAQETTVQAQASISIPTLLKIEVTNTSVLFPSPTLADYSTGHVGMSSGASVITTHGNVGHDVMIQADEDMMSRADGESLKPASHLQWSVGSGWTSLGIAADAIVPDLAAGHHNSIASVIYRMLLNEATDLPGSYTLGFTYTVLPK